LECVVNTALLGGLKIQVGDWIVDTSLKSQLDQMATILIQ
jgi:F0F1-type ATP synthase delta subunit